MIEQKFDKYKKEKMRGIFSERFWKNNNSLIKSLSKDVNLDIRLRNNEIHVYYKGGKILGIKTCSLLFDSKYLEGFSESSKVDKWFETKEKEKGDLKLKFSLVHNDINNYIHDMKNVMDNWLSKQHKTNEENSEEAWERYHQQMISLAVHDNLKILDIEFAVSFYSESYNRRYIEKNKIKKDKLDKNATPYKRAQDYPNPRFDIIAVDNKGQLYVFELKTGIVSTGNMEKHLRDFANLIGSLRKENKDGKSRYEFFIDEMKSIKKTYEDHYEILGNRDFPKNILNNIPKFYFIFTDKDDVTKWGIFKDEVYKNFEKLKNFYNEDEDADYMYLIKKGFLNSEPIYISQKDFKINLPE